MSEQHTKETLSIGAVCIGVNAKWRFDREGMECTVIGGLAMRTFTINKDGDCLTAPAYEVQWADSEITCAYPDQLRLKKPPREDLQVVRWDTCPWQPEELRV
jgi:hypothetical protein